VHLRAALLARHVRRLRRAGLVVRSRVAARAATRARATSRADTAAASRAALDRGGAPAASGAGGPARATASVRRRRENEDWDEAKRVDQFHSISSL
jgi:hypothetical protein